MLAQVEKFTVDIGGIYGIMTLFVVWTVSGVFSKMSFEIACADYVEHSFDELLSDYGSMQDYRLLE